MGIEGENLIKKPRPFYLWGGVAGGLLGSVIWVLSIPDLHHESGYKSYYYILVFAYALPIGILIGVLVGAIIAGMNQTKRRTGIIVRMCVGTLTATVVGAVYSLVLNNSNGDPISWGRYAFNLMIYGLLVGSLAGMLAGVHRRRSPDQ